MTFFKILHRIYYGVPSDKFPSGPSSVNWRTQHSFALAFSTFLLHSHPPRALLVQWHRLISEQWNHIMHVWLYEAKAADHIIYATKILWTKSLEQIRRSVHVQAMRSVDSVANVSHKISQSYDVWPWMPWYEKRSVLCGRCHTESSRLWSASGTWRWFYSWK